MYATTLTSIPSFLGLAALKNLTTLTTLVSQEAILPGMATTPVFLSASAFAGSHIYLSLLIA